LLGVEIPLDVFLTGTARANIAKMAYSWYPATDQFKVTVLL
jgi:hypothetical protein